MQILITVILAFFLIVILGFILWRLMDLSEDLKFLTHKVNFLEHQLEQKSLENSEPEQQTVIDYENLKQEL